VVEHRKNVSLTQVQSPHGSGDPSDQQRLPWDGSAEPSQARQATFLAILDASLQDQIRLHLGRAKVLARRCLWREKLLALADAGEDVRGAPFTDPEAYGTENA